MAAATSGWSWSPAGGGLCGNIGVYFTYEQRVPAAGECDAGREHVCPHGEEAVVGLVEEDGRYTEPCFCQQILLDPVAVIDGLFECIFKVRVDHGYTVPQ